MPVRPPLGKAAIIFIHGLFGSGSSTWGKWPQLLSEDSWLSDKIEINHFEYQTKLFSLLHASPSNVYFFSDMLKEYIDGLPHNEIVLVCHSLGGLVAKQYIIEEIKKDNGLRVTKVLFCAVPNDGAAIAKIARIILFFNPIYYRLCKQSDYLQILNRDWKTYNVEKRVICKYGIAELDKIVPYNSSRPEESESETIHNVGHKSLVKPGSTTDHIYRILAELLQRKNVSYSDDYPEGMLIMRDRHNLEIALAQIDTDTIDYFLDRASFDIIIHEVFYYWEGFNAEVSASSFTIYDETLRILIENFHQAWGNLLSFGEYFYPRDNCESYTFDTTYLHQPHIQKAHDEFHKAHKECEDAYRSLVKHIKYNFQEVDLRVTSRQARDRNKKYLEE